MEEREKQEGEGEDTAGAEGEDEQPSPEAELEAPEAVEAAAPPPEAAVAEADEAVDGDEGPEVKQPEAEVEADEAEAATEEAEAETEDAETADEEGEEAAAAPRAAKKRPSAASERERVRAPIDAVFGRKLGMMQIFDETGRVDNVTVIETGPCIVTMVRTPARDGYSAIQLGWGTDRKLTKPAKGHLRQAGVDARYLREIRVDDSSEFAVGQEVGVDIFTAGERVDVTATSKGRGFAGGVKRHGFHGGPKTHGQSDRHRAPGSIGAGTTPGRVLKGHKMAGHMGSRRVTVRSLAVVQVDEDRNLLMVRGSVPGPTNGVVQVKRTSRVTL